MHVLFSFYSKNGKSENNFLSVNGILRSLPEVHPCCDGGMHIPLKCLTDIRHNWSGEVEVEKKGISQCFSIMQ